MTLAGRRLSVQQIDQHRFDTPAAVVGWLGAVQGQDYAAAKWAVGLRLPAGAASEAGVEQALADGAVVRTHAMRGTWQLVAPEDVRWLLALVGPGVIARSATRYRALGLDAATVRRSNAAVVKALAGGAQRTRAELAAAMERAGVATGGQRLAHLLGRAELDALICGGARRGKQFTYALLDARAPRARDRAPLRRDEALAELARRYFRSRGPATVADFTWWSGLSAADARAGLAAVADGLVSEVSGGRTYWRGAGAPAPAGARAPATAAYLLPAFDEYLVAYRDRDAVLAPSQVKRLNAGGGLLNPCIVVGGRVCGTWRRVLARDRVALALDFFERPSARARALVAAAARRYAAFLGLALGETAWQAPAR